MKRLLLIAYPNRYDTASMYHIHMIPKVINSLKFNGYDVQTKSRHRANV